MPLTTSVRSVALLRPWQIAPRAGASSATSSTRWTSASTRRGAASCTRSRRSSAAWVEGVRRRAQAVRWGSVVGRQRRPNHFPLRSGTVPRWPEQGSRWVTPPAPATPGSSFTNVESDKRQEKKNCPRTGRDARLERTRASRGPFRRAGRAVRCSVWLPGVSAQRRAARHLCGRGGSSSRRPRVSHIHEHARSSRWAWKRTDCA